MASAVKIKIPTLLSKKENHKKIIKGLVSKETVLMGEEKHENLVLSTEFITR